MPDLTPGMRALTPFFRVIEGAAAVGVTTAALWQAVHSYAEANNIPLAGANAIDMSRMRGIAGGMVRAADVLAGLADNAVIPPEAVAQTFYSRPLAEQAIAPTYEINYQRISSTPEGQLMEWRTIMVNDRLPTTRAEVIDLVTEAAANEIGPQGSPQGTELAGIGDIRILAV